MSKLKKSGARKLVFGLLAGASSIAVLASCAPAFAAADAETKAEIRALKEQLKRLEKRLESQAQSQRQTERKVERVEQATVEAGPPGGPVRLVSKDGVPWPSAFYYKAVTITPGGFFEFAGVERSRFMGADIATPFQNIPYGNNLASYGNEYRFSARRSRFTMQTDADLDPVTHVKMYLATDFLGAGQTANLNQSDSFNFRFRELYMQIDRSEFAGLGGVHLMAGQAYSLIGLNSQGTLANTFLTPPVIDDQYMPGFTWARQPGIRLSKDITPELQWAFSAEQSATTNILPASDVLGHVAPCITNASLSIGGTGGIAGSGCSGGAIPGVFNVGPVSGSLSNALNETTTNRLPDLITKAAWDPTFIDRHIHVEVGGMLRDFTDQVYWGQHSVWGANVEAGVIIPIIPKWLDFQFSGLSGNGNGRYGAAQINDATFTSTGGFQPIHERQAMVGLTAHVTPQTDVYVFAGGEFASANYTFVKFAGTPFITAGLYSYGYGNPAYNNIGCNFEGPPALTCVGNTKDVRQITSGFWHNFYDGPAGKVRVGAQYSYTVRDSFNGVSGAYKGTESMFFTSLRYYPFN
jgi:hypothetical protein